MHKKKHDRTQTDEILNDIQSEEDMSEAAAKAAAQAAEGDVGPHSEEAAEARTEEAKAEDAADNAAETEAEQTDGKKDPEEKKEDEWKEKYTRQLAEFDNFRKRTEKEKAQMYDYGAKAIAEKILPTIDNFERGLKGAPEGAFAEGMEMVYKQLLKNLEDAGIKAIDCVGKEFDPNIHNAVMHEEDDSGEENMITEELQKGYMYKDTLLRPSMVKVKN